MKSVGRKCILWRDFASVGSIPYGPQPHEFFKTYAVLIISEAVASVILIDWTAGDFK